MDRSSLKKGIITRPGIEIDESGIWFHNKIKIENKNILYYFKKNTIRIDSDYYIYNQAGKNIEFAVIESVRGFPIFITHVSDIKENILLVGLDYGEEKTVPFENLLYFNDTTLAAVIPEKNVAARFNGYAMSALMNDLGENKNGMVTIGKNNHLIKTARHIDYLNI